MAGADIHGQEVGRPTVSTYATAGATGGMTADGEFDVQVGIQF